MKKVIWISILFVIVLVICAILYFNDMQMNESLEIRVPLLTRREETRLKTNDFFDDEETIKIYLSKSQKERILKNIRGNNNWKKGEIDEKLNERMKFYTRNNIYNEIPIIDNAYWIFTNRSNAVSDKHSIDELLKDMYYAISFGILDVDNSILYYYEYDT